MTQTGQQPPRIRLVPGVPHSLGAAGQHRTWAQIAKDIGLFFAAPFVTLAYLSLFPFIAMTMLVQAWRHRKQAG